MTADVDDEALSWGDESDPSYAPDAPAAKKDAPVERPVPPLLADPTPTTGSAAAAKPATTSFLLVSYGILAGGYLIYTLGWLVVVFGPLAGGINADILGQLMFRITQVLAVASPAIWFGASFLLTRGRRPIVRLLALLVGLVVVLPWPFILLGA